MNNSAPSLHLRVLQWLVIPLALITGVILVEVYYSASNSTERIQDRMLVSQAIGIKEHAASTGGDLVYLDLIQKTSNRTVFYKVEGPENAFVTGYSGLPLESEDTVLNWNQPHFYYDLYRGNEIRMVALRTLVEGRDLNGLMTVYVGQLSKERRALVLESMTHSVVRLGLLIILAGGLGWLAVSQGLEPLARLERAISRRTLDDLRPLEVAVPKEAHSVVSALNSLFGRLSDSIERKKRFIANASHQLRTPVASLMTQTELALRRSESSGALSHELSVINHRARQLSQLINQLLSLARADATRQPKEKKVLIDMITFAKTTTLNWLNDHYNSTIDLGFESVLDTLSCSVYETLLTELLLNLIDNANNYCPAGSMVTVRVKSTNDSAILEVEDNGPGIPAGERERVVERFYRLQEDRTGSGLGLAIANEVTLCHRGKMQLLTPASGKGLLVRVEFPVS